MLAPIIVFVVNLWRRLVNGWRRMWRRRVDYVRFRLTGPLPEFAAAPVWWQRRFLGARSAQSVQGMRRAFERIADEPQVRGVVLHIDGLQGGWATLQGLRAEIATLRAAGKRVVAYLVTPDTAGYYTACAADRIVMPPTVFFAVVGLRAQAQFLKDALAKIGVAAEVTAVSPYKSGGDTLTRAGASPEAREQLDRLLDARYAELLRAIAAGRGKSADEVRALIDAAPHAPGAAASLGLVDALRYEDQLDQYLATGFTERTGKGEATVAPPTSNTAASTSATPTLGRSAANKVVMLDWEQAQRVLRVPLARVRRDLVGLVTVEGTIASGRSRSVPVPLPLVGGRVAGAESVVQALRQAERARRIKAVVLYVNSPGGGVLASDLMWREVLRLRQKKPVVVAMGDAAASGGYYLSAPAQAIVAQPGTVTGSIGVFMLRPVLQGALEQLGVNTLVVGRGANSSFLDTSIPPTETEREAVRAMVFGYYEDFKARVRSGRNLQEEQLEPVAGGRVWLGEEALSHGLVDRLGGIPDALLLAQELAKITPDRRAPLVPLRGGRAPLPPEPFPEQPVAVLAQQLGELLRPQVWALLPFDGI
jgi:protease IV